MYDTDKIVAAILAAALGVKNDGAANAARFVQAYEEVLSEMKAREKAKATAYADALEEKSEQKAF